MANVTDPLANAVHGTDPQSLMEYITRQKIYDSRYWKEECFGLSVVGVLEKASKLKCIGASFGGNSQPTKFLSLTLKLLQIQPDPSLLEEILQNEEFKHVRVLAALYVRLSARRPADVYKSLEPWLVDYRKLRYRDMYEWKLIHVDEFIHSLLTQSRVCGISLPRLTARKTLEDEGYLDPYQSPIVLEPGQSLNDYLKLKVDHGSLAAKVVWEQRLERKRALLEEQQQWNKSRSPRQGNSHHDKGEIHDPNQQDRSTYPGNTTSIASVPSNKRCREEELPIIAKQSKKSSNRTYGMLFKPSKNDRTILIPEHDSMKVDENSEEYWNEQRAKLGLAPLKK